MIYRLLDVRNYIQLSLSLSLSLFLSCSFPLSSFFGCLMLIAYRCVKEELVVRR